MNKSKVNPYDLETLEFLSKQLAQSILNCYEWEKAVPSAKGPNTLNDDDSELKKQKLLAQLDQEIERLDKYVDK
jgi:hypothetical protein